MGLIYIFEMLTSDHATTLSVLQLSHDHKVSDCGQITLTFYNIVFHDI